MGVDLIFCSCTARKTNRRHKQNTGLLRLRRCGIIVMEVSEMSFPKYVAISHCGTIIDVAVVENEQDMAELESLFGDDYGLDQVSITPFKALKQDYLENLADLEDFVSE